MKLPELPPDAANKWHHVDDLREYGESCYAKGRADLLAEIGEPVAYLADDGRVATTKTKGCMHKSTSTSFNIPLYVLPKEKL